MSTAAPAGFPADVSLAIVTHNSAATLAGVIDAARASGCPPERTLIVDVASTDETRQIAEGAAPDIRLLTLSRNEGPNPARNLAMAQATTPYVLIIDADVLVLPGTAAALREVMDPDVGVSAPLVLHLATPDVIQYGGGGLHYICEAVNPWMDRPLAERGDRPQDIGAAPGCALLVDVGKANVIGGFDERYFMGKEDGDFLHRLRIAGFRIVENPRARVLHHSRPRSTWLFPFQVRNRWHFLLRNYEARTLLLLAPALAIHEALQAIVLFGKGHGGAWIKGARGLARMLPDLRRDRADLRRYRRRGDRSLLRADPLIVRGDLGGGPLKGLYDRWLAGYWRLVRRLVRA